MGLNPYAGRRDQVHRFAEVTRRQFLLVIGVVGSLAVALFGGIKILGFLFANATLEEPLAFTVDADPSTITVGNPLQITEKESAKLSGAGSV